MTDLLKDPALTAAIAGVAVAAMAWLRDWLHRRRKASARSVPDALDAVHDIYAALNYLLNDTAASRVLLLRATNGGKIAKPGMDLYSSVAYEVHDRHLLPARPGWQNQHLDEQYCRMLRKVFHEGHVINRVLEGSGLKPGVLRDQYLTDGVKASYIIAVATTPEAFFYLSLNFVDAKLLVDNPRFRSQLRTGTARIRAALKTGYDTFEPLDGLSDS